jgi:hypothetical protein
MEEALTERAYTLTEIDRMRKALYIRTGVGRISYGIPIDTEYPRRKAVAEDMLRTYMLAGIDAAEVESHIQPCPDNCDEGLHPTVHYSGGIRGGNICSRCGGLGKAWVD